MNEISYLEKAKLKYLNDILITLFDNCLGMKSMLDIYRNNRSSNLDHNQRSYNLVMQSEKNLV